MAGSLRRSLTLFWTSFVLTDHSAQVSPQPISLLFFFFRPFFLAGLKGSRANVDYRLVMDA